MELYLIRHGIAVERDACISDEDRPLTDKGRQKTDKVAKRLRDMGLRFDMILASPLVRSRQTAAILKAANLSSHMQEFPPLAPEGNIQDWISWLETQRRQDASKVQCLALVGHQPNLANWAETLVWGQIKEKLELKKAGVIGLHLPDSGMPIAKSELFLLTSPKWLI
ncbi:MAG: phosphohistidine phosphatase SixA [Kastovskya adunca ATA6-11-RM4]|jgi:phosphohistidine phosphatase|nr:phosphohistidine phosphatase SixA [Kastovskya adunca ATA6-11-RM4]